MDTENFFEDAEDFDIEELLEEGKNLKYKYSCFFMAIYNSKKNNEGLEKNESQLFYGSILIKKNQRIHSLKLIIFSKL